MWRRKRKPEITSEAYLQWLQAGRPPFEWFARQDPITREHLAELGREHSQDLAVAFGYAVADPRAAEASIGDDDAISEESRSRQLAANVARAILTQRETAQPAPASPVSTSPLTMSGFADRATKSDPAPRSFLGRKSDNGVA